MVKIAIGRRKFGGLLAAAVLCSRGVWAASPQKVRLIAVVLGLSEQDPEAKTRIREFRLGMRDLEWFEDRNIRVECRFAGRDLALINKHVADLVKLKPEVIVANSTPALAALREATSTIPIVYAAVNDPAGQGFVSSLSHPGANITGFSFLELEIVGKWVSLLREVKPDLTQAALMFNPDTAPYYDRYLREFKALLPDAPVDVGAAHVRNIAEIESAITKLAHAPHSALMLAGDPFILSTRDTILKLASEQRLPTISPYRQFVEEGALMSYGPDTGDIFRRTSAYVNRILKGASPSNLPAQSPVKFDLALNVKVARALELSPQESFLQLADLLIV